MKTEEEAKTNWCPFSNYSVEEEPGCNRWIGFRTPEKVSEEVACIASECMAWRWDEEESARINREWSMREPLKATPEQQAKVHGPCPQKVGYCGLAGKPE